MGKSFITTQPAFEGFDCEIQHSTQHGEPTIENGKIGVALVMQPSGQPRVIISLKHPDGTLLCAVLKGPHFATLSHILADKGGQAALASAAADRQTGEKPS